MGGGGVNPTKISQELSVSRSYSNTWSSSTDNYGSLNMQNVLNDIDCDIGELFIMVIYTSAYCSANITEINGTSTLKSWYYSHAWGCPAVRFYICKRESAVVYIRYTAETGRGDSGISASVCKFAEE